NEVTVYYSNIIQTLKTKPIVIGHSFGGLIAQKLLGENVASAAVAVDPAQMRGVLPVPFAQLKSAFPVFKNPLNFTKAVSLTADQFRYGFGNASSLEESINLYNKW